MCVIAANIFNIQYTLQEVLIQKPNFLFRNNCTFQQSTHNIGYFQFFCKLKNLETLLLANTDNFSIKTPMISLQQNKFKLVLT